MKVVLPIHIPMIQIFSIYINGEQLPIEGPNVISFLQYLSTIWNIKC